MDNEIRDLLDALSTAGYHIGELLREIDHLKERNQSLQQSHDRASAQQFERLKNMERLEEEVARLRTEYTALAAKVPGE